ncbi:hypothetical protein GCM10023189_44850 [Nibrella saemangeumensis]|uniref:THIF-type NAD/FAD binding fold domain-containing protein n=1 Tax=Nibrella saemangeumensis TaxID=1084526 RepID=A0ABP8NFZ6_9BACT
MQYQLNIAGPHYELLKQHLLPGDGKEAVAVALCGRYKNDQVTKLLVHQVEVIPYEECDRGGDYVHWRTERILPLLEKASELNLSLLKIHSHPGGYYDRFSEVDDESDLRLFPSVFGWMNDDEPHASAIMLPDGKIIGRVFFPDNSHLYLDKVVLVSDQIQIWNSQQNFSQVEESGRRTAQAFGEGTYRQLKELRIGVVGCSGTGSPVIEQLARYNVGELVIIDPDRVEHKNLNRILNSSATDAAQHRLKVDVLADAVERIGLGTKVRRYAVNLYDNHEALLDLAGCDILIGCMDSVDGRHLLNQLATFFLIPYIDVGVKLEADGHGSVDKIVGTVHYLQPGRSSLLSRKVYDPEDLRAAGTYRQNPEMFPELAKNAYIRNINVDRPAVISVNMTYASFAVNELLNRLHPFRTESPKQYARSMIDLTEMCIITESESDFERDIYLAKRIGKGDSGALFLEMPELSVLTL